MWTKQKEVLPCVEACAILQRSHTNNINTNMRKDIKYDSSSQGFEVMLDPHVV